MQNTFCLGFTGVKHSWGILLKSPWNQCYLTSSKSCASFVFSQAFSRGMISQQDWAEILGTSPKRREDGRMFGNVFGGVWSVAVTWSQRQDALGKGKDGPFTKHIWLKKKSWFQIGPFWSQKWAGQFPGISLEDSHLPLSQRSEKTRDQSVPHSFSPVSYSITPWLLSSFPSVKEWTGSEIGHRPVQVTAQRVFVSAFCGIRPAGTAGTGRWEITDWTNKSSEVPHDLISPSWFPVGCSFSSPTCKNRTPPIYVWIIP